jgi:hypothetical protein
MVDSTASVMESTMAFMEGMGCANFYLGLRCSDAGEVPANSLSFLFCLSALAVKRADNVLDEKWSVQMTNVSFY